MKKQLSLSDKRYLEDLANFTARKNHLPRRQRRELVRMCLKQARADLNAAAVAADEKEGQYGA